MDEAEIEHIREIITAYKRRLYELEVQAAKLGLQCPPHIPIEIEDIKENIELFAHKIENEALSSYQEVREVARHFRQEIDTIAGHLQKIVVEEKRVYRILGIPIFSISIIVARTTNIVLFFIGLGLSYQLYTQIFFDAPSRVPPFFPIEEPTADGLSPTSTSSPAVAIIATQTAIARQTSLPTLNVTEVRQTVAAEMIAALTAEAVKRATDIAFARILANATDSAGTQTAIALTPTGTAPPTEAPTAAPTAAPPTPTSAAPAPTSTPRPRKPTQAPQPSGSVISIGNGTMFRGTVDLGTISPELGDGGSCIKGRVTAADGSFFTSLGVQIDQRGNTRLAKVDIAAGTYWMCGLSAGESGVSIYEVGGTPIPGSEQIAHQVRVKLTGQPGEIFYINFRALSGLALPTAAPTPVSSPYDGIWRGTNSGTTTTGQYSSGRFEIEVRNGQIYRISVDGPSCPFETYPNHAHGVPITGNVFSVTGAVFNPITG